MRKQNPYGKKALEFLQKKSLDMGLDQKGIGKIIGVGQSTVSTIMSGKTGLSTKSIKRIMDRFPGEAEEFIKGIPAWERKPKPLPEINHDNNGKRIPFIDTDVYATITPSLSDVLTMKPNAFISIPMFSTGEAAVQVTGHSMKGYINHLDWLIIKRITNRASLIYGEPHLIITKADSIKTVKFIKQADQDDRLTLVPYNIEQFEPQDIRKDDILEIWRVIGLFRTV